MFLRALIEVDGPKIGNVRGSKNVVFLLCPLCNLDGFGPTCVQGVLAAAMRSGSRPCSRKRRVENLGQGSRTGRDLGEFDQGSRIGRHA